MVLPDRQGHIVARPKAGYGRIQEYDDAPTTLHQTLHPSQHRGGLERRAS